MAQTKVRLANGDVLTVDSLAGLVQLNAIRRFLAEGFQAHLQVHDQPGLKLQGAHLLHSGGQGCLAVAALRVYGTTNGIEWLDSRAAHCTCGG